MIIAKVDEAKLQRVDAKSGDNDLVTITGLATFTFQGRSKDWHREDVSITFGPTWADAPKLVVAATVGLATMTNDGHAMDAGWSVDGWRISETEDRITIIATVGVRDTDGFITSLSFSATALGKFVRATGEQPA
jgi:hypothetical protein